MDKIRDIDIRRAYIKQYRSEFGEVFINEWSLYSYYEGGGNVADMLAVKNNKIHIYEIKSETDCLKRLKKQMATYKRIADYVTLIIHKKHLSNLQKHKSDLKGVRIVVAENTVNGILFTEMNKGDRFDLDIEFALHNCWREDILRIACYKKIVSKMTGSKYSVLAKLKGKITPTEAKKLLIERMKHSYLKICEKCNSQFVRNTSSSHTYTEEVADMWRGKSKSIFRITEKSKHQECYDCGNIQNVSKEKRKYFLGFKKEEDTDKTKPYWE